MLSDLVALLDDLQPGPIHLLAHDWGALLGYHLCLRCPVQIRSYLSLGIPPPYFEFDARLVAGILRAAPFELLMPIPFLAPLLLRRGSQRLLRSMFADHATAGAFGEDDVELFLARFREPERARAGSALYRNFIQPEAVRIMSGSYRGRRLTTATRVLLGVDDPAMRRDYLHGYEHFVDDVGMVLVDGASHFLADDRPDIVVTHAVEFFSSASRPSGQTPPDGRGGMH